MRERFRQSDEESFASHELLEMLLFTAIPRKDTNALAHRLITAFGSLRGVLFAGEDALKSVEGMTPSAAFSITVAAACMRRALIEAPNPPVIRNATQMCEYASAYLFGYDTEQILCICLDAGNRVTAAKILSSGTSSSVMVHVQHVAAFAINHHAHAVIIAHNHPSDNVTPSKEDMFLTHTLQRAMEGIGIEFIDHLIVGNGLVHCICRAHDYHVNLLAQQQ
jgi:DNA repair protein RadC